MEESLRLRVIGVFAIFCATLIGVFIPTAIHRLEAYLERRSADPAAAAVDDAKPRVSLRARYLIRILSSVGAGVVITTGLVHVLPEATALMGEVLEGKSSYAVAELITVVTAVALYIFERELTSFMHRREARLAEERAERAQLSTEPTTVEQAVDLENQSVAATAVEEPRSMKHLVMTHVLQIGLALHSIVIGIALGLMTDVPAVRVLVIALCFDQGSDGVAIGASIVETGLTLAHGLTMMFSFAFMAPFGLTLGILIEQRAEHNTALDATQAALSAVSAGILLHMGFVDMLPHLLDALGDDAPVPGIPASVAGSVVGTPATLLDDDVASVVGAERTALTSRQRLGVYSGLLFGVTLMGIIGVWG